MNRSVLCLAAIALVSLFFAVSRFWAPGHPVSPWGTWEALAHLWMGALLTLNVLSVMGWLPPEPYRERPRYQSWLLFACWFGPSMVELALFLVGPFNPF